MSHERSIAILGPGLLGGSLALAVRQRMTGTEIRVWGRRQEAVDEVLRRSIADMASTDASEVVRGASLVILATPVATMHQLAASFRAALTSDALVTDVGSVKGSVVSALEGVLGSQFIGSHPMAGSERAGLEAARVDLFENAACIVTPTSRSKLDAVERVRAFWSTLGCRLLTLDPHEHDRKIARISHLPHSVAAALTIAALRDDPTAAQCMGNGFRDSTRIAAGDPDLWTGILTENRDEVVAALEDAVVRTKELLEILRTPDHEALRRFLAEAQQLRMGVPTGSPNYGND